MNCSCSKWQHQAYMWHLCLPSHCSSWESTLNPSLKMLCDGHFSLSLFWDKEKDNSAVNYIYIGTWTVEQAVCMHGGVIRVLSIFHICFNILLIEAPLVSEKQTQTWSSPWVSSYRGGENSRGTAGKQTDVLTRGQSSGAHSLHWDINTNPPLTAQVKNQISPWQPPSGICRS